MQHLKGRAPHIYYANKSEAQDLITWLFSRDRTFKVHRAGGKHIGHVTPNAPGIWVIECDASLAELKEHFHVERGATPVHQAE